MTLKRNNNYRHILETRKILYMPSCIIVEMMTRLYSQVSRVDLTDNPHAAVPDLLIMLRRLNGNLNCTSEAYRESRIKFFIGDWQDDKKRARKLFFNLMARLGYICESLGEVERRLLRETIDRMGREWNELDRVMENKCKESECQRRCGTCRHFRDENPDTWRRIMADTLVSLDDAAECRDPSTILILLCYKRMKAKLLQEVSLMKSRFGKATGFLADRIHCISDDELPITCPSCALMTKEGRNSDVIRREYDPVHAKEPGRITRVSLTRAMPTPIPKVRNRHVLPATFDQISRGNR